MRKELRPDPDGPRLLSLCRWQGTLDITKYAARSPAVVTLRLLATAQRFCAAQACQAPSGPVSPVGRGGPAADACDALPIKKRRLQRLTPCQSKVRLAAFPPCGENYARSLAVPLPTSSRQASYHSLSPLAEAHSFRCLSSPTKTEGRFRGNPIRDGFAGAHMLDPDVSTGEPFQEVYHT